MFYCVIYEIRHAIHNRPSSAEHQKGEQCMECFAYASELEFLKQPNISLFCFDPWFVVASRLKVIYRDTPYFKNRMVTCLEGQECQTQLTMNWSRNRTFSPLYSDVYTGVSIA